LEFIAHRKISLGTFAVLLDPKDAVFSGSPIYEAFHYTSVGGELTFNNIPIEFCELQKSFSYSRGGTDFFGSMASLSSVIHTKNDLTLILNLYFSGDQILQS
jgi:hypothetical protein